jgi:hypothetical protein
VLVPWPPTISPLTPQGLAASRFMLGVTKPEAFATIAPATVAQVLGARATRCVQIALSDRDGIDVGGAVVQMDDGFEAIVYALAARDLMGSRGYNRDEGADKEIMGLAEEARADLMMMAPGTGGKRVTPQYVLAAAVPRQDSVRVNSRERSDDWTRRMPPRPLGGIG